MDSPSSFEITIKGDSSCIEEFFAGLSDVVAQQNRPQVIIAEAFKELSHALSTRLVSTSSKGDLDETVTEEKSEEAWSDKMLGLLKTELGVDLKELMNNKATTSGAVESSSSSPSSLFDLKVDIDLSKDKDEQTRYTVTYNGTTRDVSHDDYKQLEELHDLIKMIDVTPESTLAKIGALIEKHKQSSDIAEVLKDVLDSSHGFTEQEQDMLKRAILLTASAGKELKSMTIHLFLAGKLPAVVSKMATKFGTMSRMAVDESRPAFSEAAGQAVSGPMDIVSQLPDILSGVMGAFGNLGGGNPTAAPSAGAAKSSSAARAGKSARSLLKNQRKR